MDILLTWWLGYIGSHTFLEFINNWYNPIIIDNLSNCDLSNLYWLEQITWKKVNFHSIDLLDIGSLNALFKAYKFCGIVHFAALKSVPDSCKNINQYHKNNIIWLMNLLDVANKNNVKKFIFSSSCTVYGVPQKIPVDESCPIAKATNPYWTTKIVSELLLQDYVIHSNFQVLTLRYFNPIWCHDSWLIGEKIFSKPLYLFPSIFYVLQGKEDFFTIFGDDYTTQDGTCIRDYINVLDLANAHILGMKYIFQNSNNNTQNNWFFEIFNIWIWKWYSVRQILDSVESILNKKIPTKIQPRRPWDIPEIFANSNKAKEKIWRLPNIWIEDSIKQMAKYYL